MNAEKKDQASPGRGREIAIGQILVGDWPSLGMCIFSGGMVGAVLLIVVATRLQGSEDPALEAIFGVMALVTVLVCGAVAAWRVVLVRRLVSAGQEVTGHVRLRTVGNNPRCVVAYTYQGKPYSAIIAVAAVSGPVAEGDTIDLLIDPEEPSFALPAEPFR